MATSILVVKIRQPKLATKISKACLGKLFVELLELSGVKPWRCGEVDDFQQLVTHSLRLTDEGATTPKLVSGWDKYSNF